MSDEDDEERTKSDSESDEATSDGASLPASPGSHTGSSAIPSQPLEPGAMLGRYEVIERLDNGGMGVVYRARHTALGKMVALKVVSTTLQADPRSMERFLREMQAVGLLQPHPYVLNAYDAGDENGVQYIATELIEGIPLSELLKRVGPLAVSEACKIIAQAALALEHFRKHDLVHRDVKPSNLMLTREGSVKIIDMGLALLRDEQMEQITMIGEAMGSIDYMAPEQWQDAHHVDWRSDVYSLGCTFYCLLAGSAPFSETGRGSVSRMRSHLEKPFPDIRDKRGDVPEEAVALLAAMVAKDPQERLVDLTQLSEKLETVASGDLKGLVARGFNSEGKNRNSFRPLAPHNAPARHDSSVPKGTTASITTSQPPRDSANSLGGSSRRRKVIAVLLLLGVLGLCVLPVLYYYDVIDFGQAVAEKSPPPTESTSTPRAAADDSAAPPATSSSSPEMIQCIGDDSKLRAVRFLDSPTRLVSTYESGMLCTFDLANPQQPVYQIQVSSRAVCAVDYHAATDTLTVACEDGTIRTHQAHDGQALRAENLIGGGFTGLTRIPESDVFVTSDWNGDVRRMDLSQDPIHNRVIASHDKAVFAVDVSPDGSQMAWSGQDPRITVYDTAAQTSKALSGHTQWIYDVEIAPDGRSLATAGHDGMVRVWSLPAGELISEIAYVVPQAVCFFPDSRHLAIGGRGGVVQVWDLQSDHPQQQWSIPQSVTCMAVSADAMRLAVGMDGGALHVYSLAATR